MGTSLLDAFDRREGPRLQKKDMVVAPPTDGEADEPAAQPEPPHVVASRHLINALHALQKSPADNTFVTAPDHPGIAKAKQASDAAYGDLMDEQRFTLFPPSPSDTTGNLRTYGTHGLGPNFDTALGKRALEKSTEVKKMRDKLTYGGGG